MKIMGSAKPFKFCQITQQLQMQFSSHSDQIHVTFMPLQYPMLHKIRLFLAIQHNALLQRWSLSQTIVQINWHHGICIWFVVYVLGLFVIWLLISFYLNKNLGSVFKFSYLNTSRVHPKIKILSPLNSPSCRSKLVHWYCMDVVLFKDSSSQNYMKKTWNILLRSNGCMELIQCKRSSKMNLKHSFI